MKELLPILLVVVVEVLAILLVLEESIQIKDYLHLQFM
jgi:hypothetical protein